MWKSSQASVEKKLPCVGWDSIVEQFTLLMGPDHSQRWVGGSKVQFLYSVWLSVCLDKKGISDIRDVKFDLRLSLSWGTTMPAWAPVHSRIKNLLSLTFPVVFCVKSWHFDTSDFLHVGKANAFFLLFSVFSRVTMKLCFQNVVLCSHPLIHRKSISSHSPSYSHEAILLFPCLVLQHECL